jgi:hypothetical protein
VIYLKSSTNFKVQSLLLGERVGKFFYKVKKSGHHSKARTKMEDITDLIAVAIFSTLLLCFALIVVFLIHITTWNPRESEYIKV